MGRITVYSITGCKHCKAAKALLHEKMTDFVEINLDKYPERRSEMVELSHGSKSVPQIFFNERHIGGNSELQALKNDGKLDDLLEECLSAEAPPEVPKLPAEEEETKDTWVLEFDRGTLELYQRLQAGIPKSTRREKLLKVTENTFTGKSFTGWLVQQEGMTRQEGFKTGCEFLSNGIIRPLKEEGAFEDSSDAFYQFNADRDPHLLNSVYLLNDKKRSEPATELVQDLRTRILHLYNEFLSEDGQFVDYHGIGKSDQFLEYQFRVAQLQRVVLEDLSENTRKAFFINIYNAMVVHANVMLGFPSTIIGRNTYFSKTSYNIGGHRFSLDDIEHGVLRANARKPGAITKPFHDNDPRLIYSMKVLDPRIHAALVCGANSCPPIKLFSPENIDDELQLAVESFFEDDCVLKMEPEKNLVTLSKILQWYGADFGHGHQAILTRVCNYLCGDRRSKLEKMLGGKHRVKVHFFSYDWTLNDTSQL